MKARSTGSCCCCCAVLCFAVLPPSSSAASLLARSCHRPGQTSCSRRTPITSITRPLVSGGRAARFRPEIGGAAARRRWRPIRVGGRRALRVFVRERASQFEEADRQRVEAPCWPCVTLALDRARMLSPGRRLSVFGREKKTFLRNIEVAQNWRPARARPAAQSGGRSELGAARPTLSRRKAGASDLSRQLRAELEQVSLGSELEQITRAANASSRRPGSANCAIKQASRRAVKL